ncbi:hypothetical protein ACFX2H_028257 [Malus domestica]
MVSGYAKSARVKAARLMFSRIMERNIVSWNTLITAWQAGSCTRIEARISFKAGEEPDIFVENSLIDIYMKCGSVEDGYRVFINMLEGDYVSWNAMIMGYAQNGYGTEALEIFRKMVSIRSRKGTYQ